MANLSRATKTGGVDVLDSTIVTATTVTIPENAEFVQLSGSTTVTTLGYDKIRPGRRIVLCCINDGTSSFALTHTAAASLAASATATSSLMFFNGGSNVTLTSAKTVTLRQIADGSWIQES